MPVNPWAGLTTAYTASQEVLTRASNVLYLAVPSFVEQGPGVTAPGPSFFTTILPKRKAILSPEPDSRRPHRRPRSPEIGRYDQALRNAKNSRKLVRLDLALDTTFTDVDGCCEGHVVEVDRFSVLMKLTSPQAIEKWIGKSFIVGTEVVDA